MNNIKLSIIVPLYNAEQYVRACIESCYKQGISESLFEVIIINDGSSDKSIESLTDFLIIHHNIIVINQTNSGVSVARNKGIQVARGKYLLFLDADDLLISESLGTMIEIGEKYNIDILKADFIKSDNNEINSYINKSFPIISLNEHRVDNEMAFNNYYNPTEGYVWRHLFRTDFIIKNKLFFLEGVTFIEDVAFSIHAYLCAKRFVSISLAFYLYRQHNTSTIATMQIKKLLSANQVLQYINMLSYNMPLAPLCKQKLQDCIYTSISIIFWYMSHHKSLYPYRKMIINDLKKKLPKVAFKNSFNQRILGFCYYYCPSLYISIRYFCSFKKY